MNEDKLAKDLKALLLEKGAALAGIGDLAGVENRGYARGVSVAVVLPRNIITDLQTAPTREYYDAYNSLNAKLNGIVMAGEKFLKDRGYEAYAQTTDRVSVSEDKRSPLPHKTVATRAGIGWIGKNCLLVTPQYGPAIRLSSLLANAPLACDSPITASRCGKCAICVEICPAQALRGASWQAGLRRDKLLDFKKCYDKQLEIMKKNTGIETDLCGKCFAHCAYARKYLAAV